MTYVIGRDTPPIVYTTLYGDHTINTEISGGIDLEIASLDRYRHNLELLLSKNALQATQKLHAEYDPAIVALTAKPEMVFESGSLKPPPINSTLELGWLKFKYSAEIEYKIDLIWHQRANSGPEPVTGTARENVPTLKPSQDIGVEPTDHTIKWDQTVAEKGVIVAVVFVAFTAFGLLLYHIANRGGLQPTPIMPPFTHTLDQQTPKA